MFCTQCGKELKDDVKFCTNCGMEINPGETIDRFKDTNIQKEEKNAIFNEFNNNSQFRENLKRDNDCLSQNEMNSQNSNYNKKNKKNILSILLTVIVVVLIIVVSGTAAWFLGGKEVIFDILDISPVSIKENEKLNPPNHEDRSVDNMEFKEEVPQSTIETTPDVSSYDDEIKNNLNSNVEERTENNEFRKTYVAEETTEDNGFREAYVSEEIQSEYIIKDSDTRLLIREDLEGLTAEQCRLARNEIYARHGRLFQDKDLQNYFSSCSWYHGTIEPSDFKESMLSNIELANRDFIVNYEKEKGYR